MSRMWGGAPMIMEGVYPGARQEHELIRPATDYGEFFDQYAVKADKQDLII